MPETGGRARIGGALAIAVVPSVVLAVVIDLSAAAAGSLAASGTVTTPETSSESPSQTPSPSPSEPTPPSPTPTGTPSATPSESPSASPSASAEPTATQTPTASAPTVDPSDLEPRPAAVRAILTADASRLGGPSFDGVVVHETAAGEVGALRFRAGDAQFDGMQVDITQAGRTFRTTSSGTTILSGEVLMDVTLFRATFAGAQVEFTPDAPPPAGLLLPVMEFTDVEIHIVQVNAALITIPGHSQSYVG